MRYEFTKDLECGNTLIDNEHKELLQVVNKLLDACSEGNGRKNIEPTLKFLLNYVNTHFAHEEQLQMNTNYPNMTAHKSFHTQYTQKLNEIADKIPLSNPSILDLGNLNQHIGILVSHIKTEDKHLGEYLNSRK